MPSTYSKEKSRAARSASPKETARYIYDMLISLKRLALLKKQQRLATLLELAATEAQAIAHPKKGDGK